MSKRYNGLSPDNILVRCYFEIRDGYGPNYGNLIDEVERDVIASKLDFAIISIPGRKPRLTPKGRKYKIVERKDLSSEEGMAAERIVVIPTDFEKCPTR